MQKPRFSHEQKGSIFIIHIYTNVAFELFDLHELNQIHFRRVHTHKKKTRIFFVNGGDKRLCFYTNVAFENNGKRAFLRAFLFV